MYAVQDNIDWTRNSNVDDFDLGHHYIEKRAVVDFGPSASMVEVSKETI
jgi:hypothetical protein